MAEPGDQLPFSSTRDERDERLLTPERTGGNEDGGDHDAARRQSVSSSSPNVIDFGELPKESSKS